MAKLIKILQNNRSVIFDRGKFDDWCVYVVEANGSKKAPFDETYFNDLYNISRKYPPNKVYGDFVAIYDHTTNEIDDNILTQIDEIVNTYHPEDKTIIEQWMTVIYAGMIAEENKENAILKKRIKRLGMYQVFVLNMSVDKAVRFSQKKPWRELEAMMRGFGF